jgi:hypothetical protein
MYLVIKVIIDMYEGNNKHKDSFEIGLEFQDYIITLLIRDHGIVIQPYSSKKYQFEVGESLQGYEIKYDARSTGDCTYGNCEATNNVAIEVYEKTNANNTNWIRSGIFREDNTTHYLIGNYHGCWIIEKRILRKLYHLNLYPVFETLPTIKSMLIPIDKMDNHAVHVFVFNENFGKQAKLEL